MSSSLQAQSNVLTGVGLITGGNINQRFNGPETSQAFFQSVQTPTSGGYFKSAGGAQANPSGKVNNIEYVTISTFQPGRSYSQFALAYSPLTNLAYQKTSAGTAILTVDPSLDPAPGGNWLLNTAAPAGPPVFNGNEMVVFQTQLQGGQGADLYTLNGATRLTSKTADPGSVDCRLRVNGTLDCEFLTVSTSTHAGQPSAGSGTLVAGVATVNTLASDPSALIFVSRTGAAGAAVGTLQVTNKGAASFTVESLDATGVVVAGDVGTFDWIIVNAVY